MAGSVVFFWSEWEGLGRNKRVLQMKKKLKKKKSNKKNIHNMQPRVLVCIINCKDFFKIYREGEKSGSSNCGSRVIA
jgi:hypothetical protein